MATVHIVGAGLAGLACAVRLAGRGAAVALYEATDHAGGRARSFHDATLDRVIDNGNHLMLAGNRSAMAFLDAIGARSTLIVPDDPAIPFMDLDTGERWAVRPNRGPVPWWLWSAGRRAPGTTAGDYLAGLRFGTAGGNATVDEALAGHDAGFRRFWEPLAVAVLNTETAAAAGRLMWPLMTEIFARGGAASRPCIARDGLSASLVDPALAYLAARRVSVRFGARLRAVEAADGRAAALRFAGAEDVAIGPGDAVVLALPPAAAAQLLPGTPAPDEFRPIVNAHFRVEDPDEPTGAPLLGLVGGAAHWLFFRHDIVSVTVSAATDMVDRPADEIAARLWHDVARALGRQGAPVPPVRVVKEKRATFAQTPAQLRKRAGPRTALANLFLAGDWTDTGLPATIESAVRSGHRAADLAA